MTEGNLVTFFQGHTMRERGCYRGDEKVISAEVAAQLLLAVVILMATRIMPMMHMTRAVSGPLDAL